VSGGRLVYSTATGRVESPAERPAAKPSRGPCVPEDGVVRLFRERGGRGGKVVTVIRGLPGDASGPALVAADLRRLLGVGGTVKGGAVELQGDHRERVAEWLAARGHRVKLAGG
jgi:translation initiation factor 1